MILFLGYFTSNTIMKENVLKKISNNITGELSISLEYIALKILSLRFYLNYRTQIGTVKSSFPWMWTRIREKPRIPLVIQDVFAYLNGWQICWKVNLFFIF